MLCGKGDLRIWQEHGKILISEVEIYTVAKMLVKMRSTNCTFAKFTMTAYGMHSSCVRQMLNNWATKNEIIPKKWKELMTVELRALWL